MRILRALIKGLIAAVAALAITASTGADVPKPDSPKGESSKQQKLAKPDRLYLKTGLPGQETCQYWDVGEWALDDALSAQPIKPVNGLYLTINTMQKPPKDPVSTIVMWEFSYSGQRQPLVIHQPSFTSFGEGMETHLMFVAKGKDGKWYNCSIGNPPNLTGQFIRAEKSTFLTVKPTERGHGFLEIVNADIKSILLKHMPAQFDANSLPELYIKMYYHAKQRGERFSFDAWTGEVESDAIPLRLTNW